MSHRVFLTSSPFPHMPIGRENQWKIFAEIPRPELEANGFLPVMWLLLFRLENIQWAYFIDDFDLDDQQFKIERQNCLNDFGTESVYPYLIVDTETALNTLIYRKAEFLNIIGEQFTEYYDEFQSMIKKFYPKYILLRTQGLPDINQAENWLQNSLIPIDSLGTGSSLEKNTVFWKRLLKDLHQYPHEVQYFLRGFSRSKAKILPQNPELEQIREQPKHIFQDVNSTQTNLIFLIFFFILGFIAAIATFLYSASIIYSFIAFMIVLGLLTYIYTRIKESQHIE